MNNLTDIQKTLVSLADSEYKAFHSKLIPNVSGKRILGVRTPILRKYAKELRWESAEKLLSSLPHRFYEEDNLHAFLLEQIDDYSKLIEKLDEFLPYVNNWATCDMMSPKCFAKNLDKLYLDAFRWIDSGIIYAVRFGICMLMKHYLGKTFDKKYLDKVAHIRSEEYYIKMAVAWFFATALTKNYSQTLPYIKSNALDTWTHNKAIQKAIESYQISKEIKEELRTYKIK